MEDRADQLNRLHHQYPEHYPKSTQTFEFDAANPRMVMVIWKDAESQGGPSWEDTDDMLEFARRPLTPVRTVGLLLHLDEEQIAVTDTIALDQMGGVTKIPRAWVERFEFLAPDGAVDLLAEGPVEKHPADEDEGRRAG